MKNKVKVYNLTDTTLNELVLTGTMEDIRTFIKDRWNKGLQNLITKLLNIHVEEDFYTYVDANIHEVLFVLGYQEKEVCEVPIEDFEDGETKETHTNSEVVELLKQFSAEFINWPFNTLTEDQIKWCVKRKLLK